MAGQAFQRWWADANRLAHSQLISVLNGDSAVVTTTGGEVVLNLVPLVNDVLHTASGPLSAMAGRAVPLHPATAIPGSACHATGGKASSACTQIPLFPAAALAQPRHLYRVLVGVLWLALIITALTFAGALAASPRRRRTLLQMSVGGALTVLIVASAASWGQSSLIGRAALRFRPVTSVIVHALTSSFFTLTTWCVAGCLAVTAIALLTGLFRRDPPSGYDRIRDRWAFAGYRRRAGRQEDEAPVRRDVQAVRGGPAGARGGHLRARDQDGPLRHVRGDRGARWQRRGTA
jgi:hypothetical protein